MKARDHSDPFIKSLYATLNPPNHTGDLENYPRGSRTTTPPTPPVNDYSSGEQQGIERPIYDYDIQRLRWILNRHVLDSFAFAELRDFKKMAYQGADGMEEYVRRVASVEFRFPKEVTDGPASLADKMEREKEGYKAQLIAARTYLLSHWLLGLEHEFKNKNPIAIDYAQLKVREHAGFQVHELKALHRHAQKKHEPFRRMFEEAAAEVRGQVLTHRGMLARSSFFAGDGAQYKTTDSTTYYHNISVHTKYGIDADRIGDGSSYLGDYGHGKGFSQNGSKTLSVRELTHLQILHWYYYDVQVRNAYGHGDVITETPQGRDWIVSATPPPLHRASVKVTNGRWTYLAAITEGAAEDWSLSQNFRANEFCLTIDGNPAVLNIDVQLVKRLQRIRYKTTRIDVKGVGQASENTLRVVCSDPEFEELAKEAGFKVVVRPRNEWDLSL